MYYKDTAKLHKHGTSMFKLSLFWFRIAVAPHSDRRASADAVDVTMIYQIIVVL